MMRLLAGLILALTLSAGAAAAPSGSGPVDTGHLTAELVAQSQGVVPGQTVWLAVRQKIQKGWHTYWRNPGDAGEPMKLGWTLPAGWRAGEIVWATPHRLPVGPLMDFGYEGEVLLPVPVTAPPTARPGDTIPVKLAASFLVCAETCVPEDALLTLDLPVVATTAPVDDKWGRAVTKALAEAPKSAGLQAVFERRPTGLALAVTGPALTAPEGRDAYFYPFASTVIEHAKPQTVERGPAGLTLTLQPGYDFTQGKPPSSLAGVLVTDGKAYEVAAAPGAPPASAAGLGPPPAKGDGAGFSLAPAAVFAFLGGLILNLMPCVFPVLAMKAAALAGHAREQTGVRRQGLAFGAGVMLTFLGLAGLLIALQAAGAAVGWGFQLQSPPVVAGLALLILGVALNLSGLFEVGTSLQGAGSGLATRQGLAGAFFTGALSVVVAAPCTAPFMGPALGWALTQSPAAAMVVFAALGLGFALPFVLVSHAPGLIARLPRPGPWMDAFKKALAFPMYAAAAWLAWVLTVQAGSSALARLLAAAVAVGLAAWLGGAAQRRHAAGGRALVLGGAAAAIAVLAAGAAVLAPYATAGSATAGQGPESAALAEQPYTPARLADLRARGAPVFVNYTAAWCVSCQVNDRVALSTPRVAEAFRREGVAYLKADWTLRDPVIAADLARFGRVGVPLYLVYPSGGGAPVVLPTILTEGTVLKALAAARAPGGAGSVQARSALVAGA
ncbi:protein-disulfide reductase DsbD family protein [Phenylobacterium sp. LjRoot225]|uniref:protein-disulfide reductase DsbD family protein n=1 Tax=Phenylobacterium sp. LjRoot225 TaxID=3342285 RepID=UPI003ECF59D8